jgi:class 3 adenylate cyclase/predicted ATPase
MIAHCAHCRTELLPEARFCHACGAPRSPAEPRDAATPLPPARDDGELRHLTVLFCDLVGSTELSQSLDAEQYRELMLAYQGACAEVVGARGGHVAQVLGDGILVYFGYPEAADDDPARAVEAALDLRETIARLHPRLAARLPALAGLPLSTRVGIHTGWAVVGGLGATPAGERLAVGETVIIAARLQAAASPGEIQISGTTYRVVRGRFEMESLGSVSLKGIPRPLRAFRVLRARELEGPLDHAAEIGLTPLAGRQAELAALRRAWREVAGGRGRAVLIEGEAGVGKSRLVRELREAIAGTPHRWLPARCGAGREGSALYPVIALLERTLDLRRSDPAERSLERLREAVRADGLDGDAPLPFLASLLSLPVPEPGAGVRPSPEAHRRSTLAALVGWCRAQARRQPVAMVFEDVHWIDPSSQELVLELLAAIESAPVLLVLTTRPSVGCAWTSDPRVARIPLAPLSNEETARMIAGVAGDVPLPAAVVRELTAKSDGIPLFVEELTRDALESGPQGAGAPAAIPASLQDSLLGRLDRLGPAKELAQLAAVIGREFSFDLIEAVAGRERAQIEASLARLVTAGLLQRIGGGDSRVYAFRHALLCDTACQSLLRSRRQQIHRRVAETLEKRFGDVVETQPEVVARHYEEAGEPARAVALYQRAGALATARSAYREAIAHLQRGISLLEQLPAGRLRDQQELILQAALGAPLMAAEGYTTPATEAAYRRAWDLCSAVADAPEVSQSLGGMSAYYVVRGDLREALSVGDQLLRRGERSGDAVDRLIAHVMLGLPLLFAGDFRTALEHADAGLALYDPALHRRLADVYGQDPGMIGNLVAGWSLWSLGRPDQALARTRRAVALARDARHRFTLVFALSFCAALHFMRREPEAAGELGEEVIALSQEQGFPVWLGWGRLLRGWSRACAGERDGVALLEQSLREIAGTGASASGPVCLAMLADAYWRAGAAGRGLEALRIARALADKTGQHFWDAELARAEGDLRLLRGPEEEPAALACFQRAVEIARGQQALSQELRAALAAARLLAGRGESREARAALADLPARFGEGFDTDDLRGARALLEDLR